MEHKSYDQIVESLKDSISYIADMNTHEMLHMSQPAMELFGIRSPEEYCGKKCYQLLHGVDRPCTFCTNNRVAAERSVTWVQYNSRLKTWMMLDDRLKELGDRKCRVETMEAIDDQQLWSQDLSGRLQMETILLQCIQTLSVNRNLDAAVNSFLEMVSRFYCADRAYIFEFDLEENTLSNTFEWCAEGVSQEIHKLQNIPMEVIDEWMLKFRRDGEICISSIDRDLQADDEDYRLLEQQNVKSLMGVPLYFEGEITGFIGVDNPETNISNTNLLRATSDFVAVELGERRMMEELEYLSYTDTLTGVYNRRKFKRDLKARYRNVPEVLGIVLVDINGLSSLNNTYGQPYGDSIIVKTAKILRQIVPGDIYRISGGEFFVPCPEMGREEFLHMVNRLREEFASQPDCNVSIGTSWQQADVDIDNQMIQADEHMRSEKQAYYHTAYENGQQLNSNPATDVLEEISAGRFLVYYQPKVNLQTGEIVGAEALVRKTDEEGNLIPPSQFIPQYEARNVLMHVDLFVLEQALQFVRRLRDAGHDIYIAVNFSRSTLMIPDFVGTVTSLCCKYDVPTSAIVLEVTETISTIGREHLRDLLREISEAGLCLSLDDFGAKYSNTSILADIKFNEVKLDKSLVDNICHNVRSKIILKNLMGMCRELEDTVVVAEGIETADQAAMLKEFNCDCGQGFYFYRPMPPEQLAELLGK